MFFVAIQRRAIQQRLTRIALLRKIRKQKANCYCVIQNTVQQVIRNPVIGIVVVRRRRRRRYYHESL
jgi:hypothetical protein